MYWKTPAVGVVEVTACRPADEEDGDDRVMVLVRWSGTRADGDRRHPRLLGQQRIYSHVMVLSRRRGVTSNADQAFSSCHCQNCGAPIDLGKDPGMWLLCHTAERRPPRLGTRADHQL